MKFRLGKALLGLSVFASIAAFVTPSQAVPAFARQTGNACSTCHFQKFPVLTPAGQDFKAAGYTTGPKGKFKSESLTIPDNLNLGMLTTAEYTKDQTVAPLPSGQGNNQGNGALTGPAEVALFFAGRVAENVGVFAETNLAGGNGAGGIAVTLKVPFSYKLNDTTRALVVPFTNDGGSGGPAFGFELASTGIQNNVRPVIQFSDIASAKGYAIADAPGATGVAFVLKNDYGFINFTPYTANFLLDGAAGNGGSAGTGAVFGDNKYLRIAATPTVGDWNLITGVGLYSGSSDITGGAVDRTDTKAMTVDFQAQGQLFGKDLLVTAAYARSDADNGTTSNLLHPGGGFDSETGDRLAALNKRDAFSIFANYSVIPERVNIGAGLRLGHTGVGTTAGVQESDNGIAFVVAYKLYQNVNVEFNYAHYSGDAYKTGGSKNLNGDTGTNAYGFTLIAAF
jgi:hypothetical protein